ncbi:MAG TPA: V-type ATPase subunit subunit G family protein [Methanoregulaceae archaeon]|nr:V-type ATPase subunit subunit G family protein [Methanoregulaceae archaeon]HPD75209.1 V-type ATPase subunit subunit G family protein [Methanoregulaceae archaeon]HRY74974.1 V-type ATPase subunit subunit G family protein [Methanoregulaceae archaeon]
MDTTKTLLQQIREKEQDVNKTIEAVRQESDAVIAAARVEAEKIRREADLRGSHAADELTKREREKTSAEITTLKKTTAAEMERVAKAGEQNRRTAAEAIVRHVTMR